MSEATDERRGDWFLSVKGRRIYLFDLRPEDVDIEEIAHSLSMLCRFNGHCREFYSVAQHSVLVAQQVELAVRAATKDGSLASALALDGLLHDGTEAYVGDMIRPLKRSMPAYCEVEGRVWSTLSRRFGLSAVLPKLVKIADDRMLQTERRDLLAPHSWAWMEDREDAPKPYDFKISPWEPRAAREEFLRHFEAYSERVRICLEVSPRREYYPGETT